MKKLSFLLFCLLALVPPYSFVSASDELFNLKLITELAEDGDSSAQYSLGRMYHYGFGMPQSYRKAEIWLRKSANQGNAEGQHSLGGLYYFGNGVPQNYILAHMWFSLSSMQGNEIAGRFRVNVEEKMTLDQIEKAQGLAKEWKSKK